MLSPVIPQTLASLARVLRSKNAGPTLLTIDIFFEDAATAGTDKAGLSLA